MRSHQSYQTFCVEQCDSKEGVVYRGDCLTCLEEGPSTYPDPDREGEVVSALAPAPGTTSSYWGESGFSMMEREASTGTPSRTPRNTRTMRLSTTPPTTTRIGRWTRWTSS